MCESSPVSIITHSCNARYEMSKTGLAREIERVPMLRKQRENWPMALLEFVAWRMAAKYQEFHGVISPRRLYQSNFVGISVIIYNRYRTFREVSWILLTFLQPKYIILQTLHVCSYGPNGSSCLIEMNDSVNEWVSERAREWMTGWMNEWLSE